LAGCTPPQKEKEKPNVIEQPTDTDTISHDLQLSYWKLTELNGKKLSDYPAQNHAPFIHLKENKEVQGTGGCNSMGGYYELKGDHKITFLDLRATEMACQGMELERDFYPFLSEVRKYAISESTLILSNEDGSLSAKFNASSSR
jgi:heat shock protein HslJ